MGSTVVAKPRAGLGATSQWSIGSTITTSGIEGDTLSGFFDVHRDEYGQRLASSWAAFSSIYGKSGRGGGGPSHSDVTGMPSWDGNPSKGRKGKHDSAIWLEGVNLHVPFSWGARFARKL